MTVPAPTLPNLDFKIYIYVMTKMIYALCVCVFNLLKIYTKPNTRTLAILGGSPHLQGGTFGAS